MDTLCANRKNDADGAQVDTPKAAVCEIYKPSHTLFITMRAPVVEIWPDFSLQHVPHLARLWQEYAATRRAARIPDGWPNYEDGKEVVARFTNRQMSLDRLLWAAIHYNNFQKPIFAGGEWNDINGKDQEYLHAAFDPKITSEIRPFALAYRGLCKAVREHVLATL